MSLSLLLSASSGLIITLITIPPIIRIAINKKLHLDQNRFQLNRTNTPNLGGAAIFIGALLSSSIFFPATVAHEIQYIFAGMVLIFFVGLKEDITGTSARVKHTMRFLTSLLLVLLAKFQIHHLQESNFNYEIPQWCAIPISLIFYLFVINALNQLDAIEHLASGFSFVFFSISGIWLYAINNETYAVLCASFSGVTLAFFAYSLFNAQNKILLGRNGSMVLGLVIASVSIVFLNEQNIPTDSLLPVEKITVLLALLAVPLTDALRVLVIRVISKKPLFANDTNHLYNVLLKAGLSHLQCSLVLIVWTILMYCLVNYALNKLPMAFNLATPIAATWVTIALVSFRNRRMSKMRRMRLIVIKNYRKNREIII